MECSSPVGVINVFRRPKRNGPDHGAWIARKGGKEGGREEGREGEGWEGGREREANVPGQ